MIAREFSVGGTGGLVKKSMEVGHSAEVFVIKQMKDIGKDLSEYRALLKKFNNKYVDFLTAKNARDVIMQPVIKLISTTGQPAKEPFLNLSSSTIDATHGLSPQVDKRYADLLSMGIVDLERPTWVIRIRSSKTLGIEDIISISTNQTVNGGSNASFALKNNLYKYTFQNQYSLDFGLPIFSPDDIVVAQTEKLEDSVLETIFTGFINKVTKSRAPGENSIMLVCEDVSKRLRYSRVGIKKGTNDKETESQLLPLSAFTSPWPSDNKSSDSPGPEPSHKILKDVFTLALSNIDSESSIASVRADFEAKYKKYNTPSAEITNKPTNLLSKNKTIKSDEEILLGEISKLSLDIYKARNEILNREGYYWRNVSNNRIEIYKNTIPFLKSNGLLDGGKGFIKKRPVAIIYGTDQPAFQLSFVDSFNMWISEWKEAHRLASEFSEAVNFEFYCDETGIIKFRPVNVSLELLKNKNTNPTYKIRDELIYKEDTSEDNTGIVNIMYASGDYKINVGNPAEDVGLVTTIKDNKLIKQFGPKMGNPISCIGLTTIAALKIYGRSKMERINSRAFSDGSIEILADPNIKVGNYIHLPETGALFYIADIRHEYSVGQKYRMTLDLTYRRRPIYDIAAKASTNKALAKRELDLNFSGSLASGPGPAVYYNDIINSLVELGYDKDEAKSIYKLSNLQEFYYYGYIWEPAVNIDFGLAVASQEKEYKDIADSELRSKETKEKTTVRKDSPRTNTSLPLVANT